VTDADLVTLVDLHFAESLREKARWCPTGESSDQGGLLYVASASRAPAGPFNAVMGTGADPAPEDTVARARAWFGARDRGFTVYVRGGREAALAARCRAEGLTELGSMPGMVLDTPPPPPPGVEDVVDEAGLAGFLEVSVPAWAAAGLGGAALRKHFAAPRRMLAPHVGVVLARDGEGRPAATALALLSHGIAGIYWVSTVPAARGRGLGAAVTAAAARWSFERGARVVCLQASDRARRSTAASASAR
jgi:GNAT superfamily N-acetyltransferase